MQQYQLTFIDLALRREALRFGKFTLKSGRESPYFFNAGLFSDGEAAARARAAAMPQPWCTRGLGFDMLFGPAYKGIALAAATAIALAASARAQRPVRLQPQGGQGRTARAGSIVGAPLNGRVLIVDDVITAGTAVRESLRDHPRRGRAAGGRRSRPGPPGARHGASSPPCRRSSRAMASSV